MHAGQTVLLARDTVVRLVRLLFSPLVYWMESSICGPLALSSQCQSLLMRIADVVGEGIQS